MKHPRLRDPIHRRYYWCKTRKECLSYKESEGYTKCHYEVIFEDGYSFKSRYDIENSKQHLFTHSINEVIRVREIIPTEDILISEKESVNYGEIETKNGKTFRGRNLLYITHDTSNDGFIDTVEVNEDQNIEKKRLIEVEIEYEQDLKEIPKKRIYRVISSIMGVFLIASFIISMIKFGSSLFWL